MPNLKAYLPQDPSAITRDDNVVAGIADAGPAVSDPATVHWG
jgi:hypothetical protein